MLKDIYAPGKLLGETIFNKKGYDYLQDQNMLACFMTVQNMTTNIIRYPFWQMMDNSAQDLFDIGSKDGCNNLAEKNGNSAYAIIDVQMNTVPSKIKMGLCLPKQCT